MNKKDSMKVINRYAGGFRHLITLGRVLSAVSALLGMLPYLLLYRIIRIAVLGENLAEIKPIAWQAVGIMLLSMLSYLAALICTHISAFRVQANMRNSLMAHILKMPLGVFDKEGTGRLRRIVSESTAATETYIAHNLPDKAGAVATPVGLAVLMLIFDYRIGLICLIPVAVGVALMMSMMQATMQEKMAEYQNALEVMSNEATEYVRGIPVVKTFGQTVHSFTRFKKSIDDYGKWTIEYTLSLRKAMVGFMTAVNAIFAALVAAAFLLGRNGVTSELILNMMYYIIITPLLTVMISKIAYAGEAEMTLIDSINRVNSLLAIQPLAETKVPKQPKDFGITMEHVSFRYPEAENDAVHDLSLKAKDGEHIALVGPSGGGKSTAAALIARFFDVHKGKVSIGEVDVKDISQEQLMDTVSFVFQSSKLLKGSILDNVRMGKPNATEQEVLKALEQAQCTDILEKLPEGIHTVIGSKGTYLSGGERQRIAIARAILKNAPILILDEATAFADPDNEVKVQKAFENMANGKTLIMIAHRLSTVVNADRIFVLKGGTCVESGTHRELMERDSLYRHMFDEYSQSVNWKVGEANA